MTALEQLEYYKRIQTYWCEMNASMTIYVKEEEWFEVGNWVYKNWDIVNGLSFLPYDGGIYKLAPYEEITEEQYKKMVENFPKIDYTKLSDFEKEDQTEGAKNYACTAGGCELV
jgi:ribonucleoside-diphosphate reductase alpha chain